MTAVSGPVTLWRIAVDTPDYTAADSSGEGARRTGGRWNRPGLPALYTSTSIALACLETVVHKNHKELPLNRYLVQVDVPRSLWQRRMVLSADQHVGWDAIPCGKVSLDVGDAWLAAGKALILQVPSVIVPEEFNCVLNPRHPAISQVRFKKKRKWLYDARVWQSGPPLY